MFSLYLTSMPIFAVQTKKSSERTVAEMIVNQEFDEIHAALAPEDMVSYVMVEAERGIVVERAIEEIPNARKVITEGDRFRQTSMTEVEQFLEPTSDVEGVVEGDFVEIVAGPYQGEKASITDVIDSKEQVTVELYEATVPIPVTLRGDQVRVLDSEER